MSDKLSHEWRVTEDEQRRMSNWAEMAKQHPTWSVAYAQDVPKLLAEIARLKNVGEV